MTNQPLHALLARMIAEGVHHARAATVALTEETARLHEGFAAQAELAAVYVSDLIIEGRMRHPGYATSPDTEAGARRILDDLKHGGYAREQAISDAIYGPASVRPEGAATSSDART